MYFWSFTRGNKTKQFEKPIVQQNILFQVKKRFVNLVLFHNPHLSIFVSHITLKRSSRTIPRYKTTRNLISNIISFCDSQKHLVDSHSQHSVYAGNLIKLFRFQNKEQHQLVLEHSSLNVQGTGAWALKADVGVFYFLYGWIEVKILIGI